MIDLLEKFENVQNSRTITFYITAMLSLNFQEMSNNFCTSIARILVHIINRKTIKYFQYSVCSVVFVLNEHMVHYFCTFTVSQTEAEI